ncbi:MAG: hypothetical protein CW691_01970 [Candidatus Bathyarchaeum sp.]|nr:MAG: hypothetical protein CW691_01970 [Candidatus Bathyarchaeum sp.]
MKPLCSAADPCSRNSLNSNLQKVRVLHVDDETGFLTTTKQILEFQKVFHVQTASSVTEATQKLGETEFDVIVSDYQMPGKDGLTFLKELRETGSNIPFILFTGKGREEVAIKALNFGADYYINKVGNPETVYSQLSHYIFNALQNRQAEERLKYKVEFESVIVRISSRFVNPVDFDEAINSSLAEMGQISDASRVYIFLLQKNETALDNTYEWCAKGVTPQIERLQNLPVEVIPWWMKQLRDGNIIHVKDVSLMSPEAKAEKEILENQDIKSVIVLPLTVSGELAGFIGFDNVERLGAWSSDDVALLQIVSELIGSSLERKRTEQQLKESEKRHRLLEENNTDVTFIQDLDLNVKYVSPSVEVLSGYTPEEVMKLGPKFLMTEESFESGLADFKEALFAAEKNPDVELPFRRYEYVCKDGSKAWGEFKPKLLRDSNGHFVGIQGTLRDVTERKRAEDALRQEHEMLELFTANIGAGLTIISKDYKILWANKFFRKSCGDVTGKTCYSVYRDRASVCSGCGAKEIFETGKEHVVSEQLVSVSGGQLTWVQLIANPIKDKNGEIVAVSELSVCVNERKQMESRLQDAEQRYRALFDKAPLGILIVDSNGIAVEFNDQAHRQLGYSREEFEKLTVFDYEVVETRDETIARMQQILKSGKDLFETKHRTKRGEIRDILNTVHVIVMDGKQFFHVITRDITEQKKAEKTIHDLAKFPSENPNPVLRIAKDGTILYSNAIAQKYGCNHKEGVPEVIMNSVVSSLRSGCIEDVEVECGDQTFSFVVAPIPEADYVNIYGRNITAFKAASDLLDKTMNELVLINEKLDVVGKLTRHDARNKLSIIVNNVYLAKQQLANNNGIVNYFDAISSAVDQIENLFSFARIYEMLGAEDLTYVDVKRCVDEAASLFSGMDAIHLVNGCSGLKVLADSLLRQFFYNLIDDSLKHGGHVSQIKVYFKEGSGHLKLVYEDNGVGIPEDEKEKIFKEGYGKGTGYGLYLIRKMCAAYGWTIQETGMPGKGAQFTITIPKLDKNAKMAYTLVN